jgi:biopolymer transport protein ExbD
VLAETPAPEEHEDSVGEQIPIIPLAAISLINLVLFVSASSMLKRRKKANPKNLQRYLPHKQLIDAIGLLEERVSTTGVDLDDSTFRSLLGAEDLAFDSTSQEPQVTTVSIDDQDSIAVATEQQQEEESAESSKMDGEA